MTIDKKPANLEFLMSRWSAETHTFVAACGEFGPSMEDVAMLTSLSIFDEAHMACLYRDGENNKRIDAL